MDATITEFLQAKRLAVVGVSRSPQKFGTAVYTELKTRGFEVYGVNPHMETILGDKCYPALADLAGKIDGVIICVQPQQAAEVLREAAAMGITRIWVQQGAQSLEVIQAARELGVSPVMGKCILMYAGKVTSVHAFHRFFARAFGQY